MGNLLRCLTKQNREKWDSILAQAEFSYNDTVNRSTGKSPFQIVYGTHPRGILELRELPNTFPSSSHAEEFAEAIKEVQDQVKLQLQNSNQKYKEFADQKRREVQFKVGDLVWAYLKKERLPQTKHTKLLPKKVGPCQILEKYGHNAYKIQLPTDIGISPIFNVCDLTRYKGSGTHAAQEDSVTEDFQQLPKPAPPQLEKILDTKIKKTRRRKYTQYLVKWKNRPVTEAI